MIEKINRPYINDVDTMATTVGIVIEAVNKLINAYNKTDATKEEKQKSEDMRAVIAQVGCVPRIEVSKMAQEVQAEQMFTAMFGHKPGVQLKSGPNQHIVPDYMVEELKKQLEDRETKDILDRGFMTRKEELDYLYSLIKVIVKGDK